MNALKSLSYDSSPDAIPKLECLLFHPLKLCNRLLDLAHILIPIHILEFLIVEVRFLEQFVYPSLK